MSLAVPASAVPTAPLRVHPYDPEQRKVLGVVGLAFLALAVVFPVLHSLDPVAVPPATLLLSPLLVVASAATLGAWFLAGRVAFEVHDQGFVVRGPFATSLVAYGNVASVRYKLIEVVGGAATFYRGFFEVRLHDGQVVKPTLQLERIDEAISAVIERTMPYVGHRTVTALGAGHVVSFGPFELHPQGIVCKGRSIPWARVAVSTSGGPEAVQLLDVDPESGDYSVVHEAKTWDVPNVDALEAIADRQREQAIRGGRR